ncbi:hypothetical protein Droror1_Dr00020363 [Drosera rotundifolia]
MERTQLEKALMMLQSAISQTKWRLKPSSRHRFQIDVLALCTGMRPVVMVDYGGKMPEIQQHLCAFLELVQKVDAADDGGSMVKAMQGRPAFNFGCYIKGEKSTFFEPLRVMVVEDMIYLVNFREFTDYIDWSIGSETNLSFIDLEQDPPKMITNRDENSVAVDLSSIQKLFSLVFTQSRVNTVFMNDQQNDGTSQHTLPKLHDILQSQLVDMSFCMKDRQLTIPTLNGWLLGYPVVYLFRKDYITDAICNLSTKSLHLFKVLVRRNDTCGDPSQGEELMSFSVPYDLSMDGGNEPWAEAFLLRMKAKWERCKHAWRFLKLEAVQCYPQAIAF